MKFALTLLMVAVALWLLLGGARRLRRGEDVAPPKTRASQTGTKAGEAMVACAHCGVHLPLSDAVSDGAQVYCGEPHRLAGPRSPDQ